MTHQLKVARIGNSRGVRLPASTIARYNIGETVTMEETLEGILLRPERGTTAKLSWKETAREMATSGEEWSDWDSTVGDGLEQIPWDSSQVAQSPATRSSAGDTRGRVGERRARKKK